jgi:IclR family acetate operon transcriptional repressor
MRMFTEVGRLVMPHCTGVGKAILSTLPDDAVVALLRRTGMPARTEHTITKLDDMLAALAQVRELGYAIDDGEQELGVRCIAAAVHGLPFAAAVSVSGPSSRLGIDHVPAIAPDIQAVAAEVSEAFHSVGRMRPAS